MDTKKIGFVHTVHTNASAFQELVQELMPGYGVVHIVDELLLMDTIEHDRLRETTKRRLVNHLGTLEDAQVSAMMVTCSTLGPAVEAARPFVATALFRVDDAMASAAVQQGKRIGVLATLSTTLEPTRSLVERHALASGKDVEIISHLCIGAFEAAKNGDAARHDEIIRDAAVELAQQADVLVLAQASMARAARSLEGGTTVLTSPRLAIEDSAKRSTTGFVTAV